MLKLQIGQILTMWKFELSGLSACFQVTCMPNIVHFAQTMTDNMPGSKSISVSDSKSFISIAQELWSGSTLFALYWWIWNVTQDRSTHLPVWLAVFHTTCTVPPWMPVLSLVPCQPRNCRPSSVCLYTPGICNSTKKSSGTMWKVKKVSVSLDFKRLHVIQLVFSKKWILVVKQYGSKIRP